MKNLIETMKKDGTTYTVLLILTVFSIFLNGYLYGVADSPLRVPIAQKIVDPSLYENDAMVEQLAYFYTYVHYILWPFNAAFGIEAVSFWSRFLAIFMSYVAVYHLSMTLFKDKRAALLAVLFLLVAKPAMGDETYRLAFQESEIALPLLLFAFVFMLQERYVIAFALAGISTNLHMTSALPVCAMFFFYVIINSRIIGWKTIGASVSVSVVGAMPMIIWILMKPSGMPFIATDFWMSVIELVSIHQYLPYLWFDNRLYLERWLRFGVFILAYALAFRGVLNKHMQKMLLTFLTAIVAMFFAAIFFSGVVHQPHIMNLQLVRPTKWISFFGAILLANYLVKGFSAKSIVYRFALTGLGASYFMSNFKGVAIFLMFLLGCMWKKNKLHSFGAYTIGLGGLLIGSFATFYPSLQIVGLFKIGYLPLLVVAISLSIVILALYVGNRVSSELKKKFLFFAIASMLVFVSCSMVSLRFEKPYPYSGTSPFEIPLEGYMNPSPIGIGAFVKMAKEPSAYIAHSVQYGYKFPRNDWEAIQAWTFEHTNKQDIFITPPHWPGFRIYSKRTIIGEWGDVILATANEKYARDIMERMSYLCDSPIFGECDGEYGYTCANLCNDKYKMLDEKKLSTMARKYNATYVIVEKPKKLDFRLEYENDGFRLYRMP